MSQRAQQIKERADQAGIRAKADVLRDGQGNPETAKHRARAAYLEGAVETLCREIDFGHDMRKPRPVGNNRLCLGAFGSKAVALEYETDGDENGPVARLMSVWFEGHANSADDAELFTPQLIARWELVVQADYEHHLAEMARDALDLAAQNAHEAPMCPFAAAAAEDRFISQRDHAHNSRGGVAA